MNARLALVAAIVSTTPLFTAPHNMAIAADDSAPCSRAQSTLAQAHAMLPAARPATADIDRDFAATEYRVAQAQVVIGHVVAKCSKIKANREAALEMAREAEARMALFRNQGTSL